MTGWYIAAFLYLVGWVAMVDTASTRSDSRNELALVVFGCAFWPILVPIWMAIMAFRMAYPTR